MTPDGTSLGRLVGAVRLRHPDADVELLQRVHACAARWHEGQRRRSGEPFITHPVAVATIVAELGMRPPVVCAALLHDTVLDTPCTIDDLTADFGPEIASLVRRLEDPLPDAGEPRQVDEVLILKMADRLHNMRTLHCRSHSSRQRVSRETLAVHVPLARQIGVETVGRELEALASAVIFAAAAAARARSLSERLLAWTSAVLPPAVRTRWLEEWYGELATLPTRRARLRFAMEVARGMPRLAAALRGMRGVPAERRASAPFRTVLSGLVSVLVGGGVVALGPLAMDVLAVAVLGGVLVLAVVLLHRDDGPARRLVELIKAWRGTK